MRMTGRISKWIAESGWGICNSYPDGANAPHRYFVHVSRLTNPKEVIERGCRISFIPGPPRCKNDLPAALEIEVFPAQISATVDVSNCGAA